MKKYLIMSLTFAFLISSCKKNIYNLSSPDGKIKASVCVKSGKAFYNISLDNKKIIFESQIGISLTKNGQDFTRNISIKDTATLFIVDAYKTKTGKRSDRVYIGNELRIGFINQSGNKMDIIFRASNDGVAFRYKLNNTMMDTVKEEISCFNLPVKTEAWIQYNQSDFGNYELHYNHRLLDTMSHHEYLMPGLFMTSDTNWIMICDASVFSNYAACRLFNEGNGNLRIRIPGCRGRWEEIAAEKNLETPWRVIMIGNKLGNIVESTIIEDLNPPSVIEDQSWIKPGVTAFPWWAISEANDKPEVLKKYIDMAAEMGWKYLEFDLACMGWYQANKPAIDFWRTVKFIPDIIKYAASKGIDCYGWDMRSNMNTTEKLKEIISVNKKLGLKGIKVDFVNDDNQFGMRFREEVLREAAKNQMMISFHGDMAPRGMCRTYPNLMTQEGVMGCEYYKQEIGGGKLCITPEHNCTLPYTRNVVGSMDYTPTAFSATGRITTYAHELAFSVICESGWLCMCDKPEAYLNSPAKDFLKKIVAAWDDTKFIDGFPGKFCCMARRHGNDWYIVCISASDEMKISLPLTFLKNGEYKVKLYRDGADAMNTVDVKEINLSNSNPLEITIAKNGGFAIFVPDSYIEPANKY